MSDDELEQSLRDEAEAVRDVPMPPGASGRRANHGRSTVYSIRLTSDEVAAVQAAADQAGLPASALVRSWIVDRLRGASSTEATLRALIHEEVRTAVREALAS